MDAPRNARRPPVVTTFYHHPSDATHVPDEARPLIHVPAWMNERRQVSALQLMRTLVRVGCKVYLTSENVREFAAKAKLELHELDRAIDDLFALKVIDVRCDGLTSVIDLNYPNVPRVVWTLRDKSAVS